MHNFKAIFTSLKHQQLSKKLDRLKCKLHYVINFDKGKIRFLESDKDKIM